MTQSKLKKMIAQIEKSKKIIAIERDKLRELLDEINSIEACSDEACGDLENAIDCLSQYL